MDLDALRQQYQGRRFGELVLHHHKTSDTASALAALREVIEELPEKGRSCTESWIDDNNASASSEQFWRQDCGEALVRITAAARQKLQTVGVDPRPEDLFAMFQIVVLNFAYASLLHPQSKAVIQNALYPSRLRLTFALKITAVVSAWGLIAVHPHIWLPLSGLLASVVESYTRAWVLSNKQGESAAATAALRGLLMLVGVYSMVSAVACVGLALYWIFAR